MDIDKEKIRAIESDDPAYLDLVRSLDDIPDISFNPAEMVAAAKREKAAKEKAALVTPPKKKRGRKSNKASDDAAGKETIGNEEDGQVLCTTLRLRRDESIRLRAAKLAIDVSTNNPVTFHELLLDVFEDGFKVKYPELYDLYCQFVTLINSKSNDNTKE